ncbi:MAG: sulfotransferase family 2 domain-containing protein [Desulfovibrionaceae bacterium]
MFDHIPKCGGTTLYGILERFFNKNEVEISHTFSNMSCIDMDGKKFVRGHRCWGVHELDTERKFFYFTFLRDPYKIVTSYYAFLKSRNMIAMEFDEYLTQRYEHNFLVRHLGRGSLEAAKRKIVGEYALFGLVERYDESLSRLLDLVSVLFGVHGQEGGITYEVQNRSKNKPELSGSALRYFRETNALDLELYAFAEEMFSAPVRVRDDAVFPVFQQPRPGQGGAYVDRQESAYAGVDEAKGEFANAMARKAFDEADAALRRGETFFSFSMYFEYLTYFSKMERYEQCVRYTSSLLERLRNVGIAEQHGVLGEMLSMVEIDNAYYRYKMDDGFDIVGFLNAKLDGIDYSTLSRIDYPHLMWIVVPIDDEELAKRCGRDLLRNTRSSVGWDDMAKPVFKYLLNSGNVALVAGGGEALLRGNRYDFDALQMMAVLSRKGMASFDLDMLRDYCETVQHGPNRMIAARELVVTAYERGVAPDEALGSLLGGMAWADDAIGAVEQEHPDRRTFGELLELDSLLVVCSGPLPMLSMWLRYASSRNREGGVGYVMSAGAREKVESAMSDCAVFPRPFFEMAHDFEEVASSLARRQYDAVLFFMSTYRTDGYAEITALAKSLSSGPVFFCLFDQVFSMKYRDSAFVVA